MLITHQVQVFLLIVRHFVYNSLQTELQHSSWLVNMAFPTGLAGFFPLHPMTVTAAERLRKLAAQKEQEGSGGGSGEGQGKKEQRQES